MTTLVDPLRLTTERKWTKYGLAHQIPPDLSVRRIHVKGVFCDLLPGRSQRMIDFMIESNLFTRELNYFRRRF